MGFCFCFGLEILIAITHLGLFIQMDSSVFEAQMQVIQWKLIIQQGNADALKQKFIKSFKAAASNSIGKMYLIRASKIEIIIRCAV